MAGGVGARFWPISRHLRPKQLLDLLGEGTLLEQTLARIEPLVPPDRRWIVTNREQMLMVREQMPSLAENRFILEPVGKNTAPAIGLTAVHLVKHDPDAVMVLLPADHRIRNVAAFRECLLAAVEQVAHSDVLATIGIEPSRPETGYGYIQVNHTEPPLSENIFWVKTFAEKPNLATARLFCECGEFVWNSGVFVWRADVILQQIAEFLPQWYAGLHEIAEVIGTEREAEVTRQVFASRKGISIDYAVMEHAPRVAVVRGTFDWSDVGSWDEIWRLTAQDERGNAKKGPVCVVDSSNSLVLAKERLIALVGVENLVVVDAGDAILICPRESSQQVRSVVDALHEAGQDVYL